ncbi:MAG: 23S rRNA (guanosine(2251)-2'-O)-methyltransferase RlmB, partial [Tissierellales bacterium]
SKGVSSNLESLADRLIKIPMVGKAESLNAAVASSIIMYEVLRQRINKFL